LDNNGEPIKVDEVEESQDMNPKQVLNILFKEAKTKLQNKHLFTNHALLHRTPSQERF